MTGREDAIGVVGDELYAPAATLYRDTMPL